MAAVFDTNLDPKLFNADLTTEAYEEASGMNSLICILSFKVWLAAFLYHLAALICLKAHTIRFNLISHLIHVNEVRSHILLRNQLTEMCCGCTIITKICLGKKKKKSVYYREQAEHDTGKERRLKDRVNFLKEVHIIRSIQVTIFNDVAWVTAWHSEMVEGAKRKEKGKKSRKVQKEVQNSPLAKKLMTKSDHTYSGLTWCCVASPGSHLVRGSCHSCLCLLRIGWGGKEVRLLKRSCLS